MDKFFEVIESILIAFMTGLFVILVCAMIAVIGLALWQLVVLSLSM